MAKIREIKGVETGTVIAYSFNRLTYRKFQQALSLFTDSQNETNRVKKNQMVDEACAMLISNASQLLDEASNADVQQVIADAIDFNQLSEADLKKSE